MPRPRKCRLIAAEFGVAFFGPKGIPMRELEQVSISHDELEALRLADVEGLYHEDAAQRMGVSRATFGRTLASGRKKVAGAVIGAKGLLVHGGDYAVAGISSEKVNCRYWQGGGRNRQKAPWTE